jgi:AraC-like DNA-binding protein
MDILNLLLIIIIVILLIYCTRLKLRQPLQDHPILPNSDLSVKVSNNDIMHCIRNTAVHFNTLMEENHLEFSIKCNPDSMMGWTDTDKIDKIILLLLSDMAQHTPSGGKVMLEASTNTKYDHITISFNDTGSKLPGTGLTLVSQLVSLHHGTLNSNYYEGHGNSIYIELPIKKEAYQFQPGDNEAILPTEQLSTFHIPNDIALNVPTIQLPKDADIDKKTLESIVQEAYESPDQKFLQRAINCVKDHIDDSDYDRETFAADMGASPSSLYNKIRALTGKSITNFIRDIRIQAACRMAKENPDLRISDIAYRVGFRDPKYFATSFKRVIGTQPKEYFEKLRAE